MKGAPTTFWGKLQREEGAEKTSPVAEWHPLLAHCADVAACTEAILERTLMGERLARLASMPTLDVHTIARLGLLAALHDIGKFNHGFQRKGDAEPRDVAGHVKEAIDVVFGDYAVSRAVRDALPPEIDRWSDSGVATSLLVAAIGHHGRPIAIHAASPPRSELWLPIAGRAPIEGIASLVEASRRWFPRAFGQGPSLPESARFQHAFAGVVMLADWLGSDRDIFPYADSLADRMAFARERARLAVARIGLDSSEARLALGTEPPGFDRVLERSPRDAQVKLLERPIVRNAGTLATLESETGSGKTEAALGRFLQLLHAGLVDGTIFALPTRTAATQIHRRVHAAMARAFRDQEPPPVVLAVPGYLQVDDVTGRRLAPFEVLWNDDDRERYRYRGWAAENPKRYLAGAIVVSTIDQVLLSSLRVGHAHLRATALLRQFLVVDEVHASDAYMTRILEEVLRFHVAAGGHALLMSATLGTETRARLEAAALDERASATTLEEALASPYPVVHDLAHDGARVSIAVEAPGLPKAINVATEAIADDPLTVAATALDACRRGARVLVLRNTVRDAIATQVALETLLGPQDRSRAFEVTGILTLHHSRFARSDRTLLDDAIESTFGKGTSTQGGRIAVATQTVQQSLDLDADLLLTDLAPMDVLLQRLGRVHRHRERDPHRPIGFERARALVLVGDKPLSAALQSDGSARGSHGVGHVYEDLLILEATRRELLARGTLQIPADNRALVERTTHPESLESLAALLGDPWPAHLARVGGRAMAHRNLAILNVVDRNIPFGDYHFRESRLQERISARLGESDRRAVFPEPPIGPFGTRLRELTLPGWMTREVPADPNVAPDRVTTEGVDDTRIVRFRFGPLAFSYGRFGLQRDAERGDDDDPVGA